MKLTTIAAGTLAIVPVPGMGTAGLMTIEAGLIYWIARIYGERFSKEDIVATTATLGVASIALKAGLMEALNWVPLAGWILKAPLAAGVVQQLGKLSIKHFEDKHPGKLYTVDTEVENQRRTPAD